MKNILVINGNPDKESYNYALSEAYLKGARKTDSILSQINISDLNFNPNLAFGYSKRSELEPDLLEAIEKNKKIRSSGMGTSNVVVWLSRINERIY